MKTATDKVPKKRLTKRQKHVKAAIESLTHYMVTYPQQSCYMEYDDECIIGDVLYGLGVALDEQKFKNSDGFSRFKTVLKAYIEEHP